MPLFAEAVDELFAIERSKDTWWPDLIELEVATSVTDDEPITINFADTIGHRTKGVTKKTKDTDLYWLPRKLNENTDEFRKKQLSPYFVQACRKAGFSVKGGLVLGS